MKRYFEKISFEQFSKDIKNDKELYESYNIPKRQTKYAAGYDLFADVADVLEIQPHQTAMIPTGLAMELPEGYWGGIFARS